MNGHQGYVIEVEAHAPGRGAVGITQLRAAGRGGRPLSCGTRHSRLPRARGGAGQRPHGGEHDQRLNGCECPGQRNRRSGQQAGAYPHCASPVDGKQFGGPGLGSTPGCWVLDRCGAALKPLPLPRGISALSAPPPMAAKKALVTERTKATWPPPKTGADFFCNRRDRGNKDRVRNCVRVSRSRVLTAVVKIDYTICDIGLLG